MDPAIQEHIKTKIDPAIQEHIKTKIDPAIQERITTKEDPAIQEHITTNIDPAIQNHTTTQIDPALQEHIKNKIDSAIQAIHEHIATKIDPAIQAIHEHIATKIDPAILEHIKTKIDPALQEHIQTKKDPAIQRQMKTKIDPAIQEHITTNIDPAIQDHMKTKIDPALQEHIETKINSAIQEYIKTRIDPAIQELNEKKVNEAVISSNQQKVKLKDWKESPLIQIIKTSVVIVLFGTALAVYWNLESNRNEIITIYPNGTFVVQGALRMENVTLSLLHLKEVLQWQNDLKETLSKIIDSLLLLKRDVQVLEGQEEIRNSKTIFFEAVLIFLFGLAEGGCIFILFVKYWLPTHTGSIDNNEYSQPRHLRLLEQMTPVPLDRSVCIPSSSKLREQVKHALLDRSVCIVSFYEETQKLHMRLAKSAIQADIPIRQFLMKNHETQLMSIPGSRFILVFVDYNERNIILETTGQDLGDKKLATVQAAQKMGADVFVVYVRDKGSTNLPKGVLYNGNLAPFTRHPTLVQLTVKLRGLSVYETFTDDQKSHINGIVS